MEYQVYKKISNKIEMNSDLFDNRKKSAYMHFLQIPIWLDFYFTCFNQSS